MPDIRVAPTSGIFQINNALSPREFALGIDITGLTDGGFATIWHTRNFLGGVETVLTRVVDQSGTPLGSPSQANGGMNGGGSLIFGGQAVAASPDGGFIAAWHRRTNPDVFNLVEDVFTLRHTAEGAAVGGVATVNVTTAGKQNAPSLTALQSGTYAVVWSDSTVLAPGDTGNARFQLFDPSGQRLGNEQVVNTTVQGVQSNPSIAALNDQRFVVVWQDSGLAGSSANTVITGIFVDAAGTRIGPEFTINSVSDGTQVRPVATSLSSGGFVVTWLSNDSDPSQSLSSVSDIKAQVFDAAGNRIGGEFLINDVTAGAQNEVDVARLNGGFVVVWTDGSTSSVKARVYADDGTEIGEEFLMNADASMPATTMLSDGSIQFAWNDGYTILEGSIIAGQRFGWLTDYEGTAGADLLQGSLGDDFFLPGAGADQVRGFGGRDTISYANSASAMFITLAGGWADDGTDSDTFLEIEDARGSAFADIIYGTRGANLLTGGGGADILIGYGGDDQYFIDDAAAYVLEGADAGDDTIHASVDYIMGTDQSIELLRALNAPALAPISLVGNGFAQTIAGNNGANLLIGGGGGDGLIGFAGDDAYLIMDVNDIVYEAAGEGHDVVLTRVNYALPANVEILVAVQESSDPIGLASVSGGILIGNAGNNIFWGAPLLAVGGNGDDTYYVNSTTAINELAGGGTDLVVILSGNTDPSSPVTFQLTPDAHAEILQPEFLIGTRAYDIFGNDTDNIIYGNDGANSLTGNAGNDILLSRDGIDQLDGGDGDDQLNGGFGADTITGGAGADMFVFMNADTGDVIADFESGVDTIKFAGMGSFDWIDDSAFSGVAGEVRFDGGQLQADFDGNSVADLVVTVNGQPVIESDFFFGI